jgi:hypothetical protein
MPRYMVQRTSAADDAQEEFGVTPSSELLALTAQDRLAGFAEASPCGAVC